MKLLRFLRTGINSLSLSLIDQNFVQDETIEQTRLHVLMRPRLKHVLQLLHYVELKTKQIIIVDS